MTKFCTNLLFRVISPIANFPRINPHKFLDFKPFVAYNIPFPFIITKLRKFFANIAFVKFQFFKHPLLPDYLSQANH